MKTLKTYLLICMAVLGLAFILPSHSAQAATTSTARQIRVDESSKRVTIDFKSFSTNGYTFALTTPSNTTKTIKPTVTTSNGAVHAQFSISGYTTGLYSVTVTSVSSGDTFSIGFYNYSGISSVAFTWSSRTISWKDASAEVKGPAGTTPKYMVRLYTSEANATVPNAQTAKYTVASGSTSKVLPTSLAGGTYYVTVTPYFETSTSANYYGPQYIKKITYVGTPSGVKATAGYKSATVTWSKVSGATGYVVKDTTSKKSYTVSSGSTTSQKISGLTEGTTYNFIVYAKNGSYTSSASAKVSATIPHTTKSKASNVSVVKSGSSLKISWTKAANTSYVNGYKVYFKKSSASSYTLLTTTTGTSVTTSKTFSNTNYVFMVKPYTTINGTKYDNSATGATVTVNPYTILHPTTNTVSTSSVRTIGYYSKTNKSAPIYNTATSTKVVATLAKGTKVEQVGPPNGTTSKCRIKYNGKSYYIKRGAITSYAENYSIAKRYSKSVKEAYVNKTKKLSSNTNYLIWISHYTQQVTIFKGSKGNWTVYKVMDTATGKHSSRSPLGVTHVTYKEAKWQYTYTYESYVTHYNGRNSFHTRVHYNGGGYADATINKPASHGCARLYDSDAKWIYNNIPKGTTVLSW